ncbi:uncharacterized protein TNCV_1896741 [Trichonephila clavipes]|nr:uncharacterized protein TNCV_1896741 [Trichonephila clavipes]
MLNLSRLNVHLLVWCGVVLMREGCHLPGRPTLLTEIQNDERDVSLTRIVSGLVTSSSPVPLKTHRVGGGCTLDLTRAETSSRWCGVVVRRGECRPRHLTRVQNALVRRQKPSCS